MYGYVGNRPTMLIDPLGHTPFDTWMKTACPETLAEGLKKFENQLVKVEETLKNPAISDNYRKALITSGALMRQRIAAIAAQRAALAAAARAAAVRTCTRGGAIGLALAWAFSMPGEYHRPPPPPKVPDHFDDDIP
jgi:hypothetical protein